jgi:dihydrolipoyl dehydrogenase
MSQNDTNSEFDVLIIGSGPGGYVAAIRAAQLGLKTALVEREHLGGVCLNWGCIPSKALLRSADTARSVHHAGDFGVQVQGVAKPDLPYMVARSRIVSKTLNGGVDYLVAKNKITLISGEASIDATPSGALGIVSVRAAATSSRPQVPPPANALGPGCYRAKNIIVATGARPRILPELVPDQRRIWTYFEAMTPPELPRSLIVVGSGAIGVEFASFYRSIGTEVTVVEMLDQFIPSEDAEIARLARRQFQKQGIKVLTGTKVVSAAPSSDGVALTIETSDAKRSVLEADRAISAVGVVANTEGLGLDSIGVELAGGWVKTDGLGRTNAAGLYAIGDVSGPPMLAHKAEHEAIACVDAIRGLPVEPLKPSHIPSCIYSYPQIASIGLTESDAEQQDRDVLVGRCQFRANGKAIAQAETDGLVKTIFDGETRRLLGAQMIGAEVVELMGTFAIALQAEATLDSFRHAVFPHPTLSEAIFESALSADSAAIHL